MRRRAEMHRRMLDNGYCARPVEMDGHFECIDESGTFFVTTIAFRPTLQQQRDDERQGEVGRQKLFAGLLTRLDQQAAAGLVTGPDPLGTCPDHPHMHHTEHRHTGLGLLTPHDVHSGVAEHRVRPQPGRP